MKTLLKLVALGAAAYGVTQLVKKNKQKNVPAKLDLDKHEPELAKVAEEVTIDPTIVQNYRVQTKVLLEAFPENSMLDCVHTISFVDEVNCEIFKTELSSEYTLLEQSDAFHCVFKEQVNSDAQSAFDAVLKVAQLAANAHGIYQDYHFVKSN